MQNHIAQFQKYLLFEKRYSQHTASSYFRDISQLADFLSLYGVDQIASISEKNLRMWIRHLVSSEVSSRSVNRKLTAVKSFFRFLIKTGVVETSPAQKLQALKTEKTLPVFIDEQALDILSGIDFGPGIQGARDELIIDMFYTTGIRLSELTGLERKNLNLSQRQIKVMGKRRKERIIPLLDSTVSKLKNYLDLLPEKAGAHNRLFVTEAGDEIYPKLVYRIVNKYLNLATTAKKKSPHVLRHSFATHMLNKGADLNSIKEILGHANLAATEVYTHNSFEQLKNVYLKSHPRE